MTADSRLEKAVDRAPALKRQPRARCRSGAGATRPGQGWPSATRLQVPTRIWA